MPETWVQSLGWADPLEKKMTTHSSILAWRIPWRDEPGGLQSTGLQRVGHGWENNTFAFKGTGKRGLGVVAMAVVPNLLAPRAGFVEDNFSTDRGEDSFRMIQVHYAYWALYFYYYCISSTSDHHALYLETEDPWEIFSSISTPRGKDLKWPDSFYRGDFPGQMWLLPLLSPETLDTHSSSSIFLKENLSLWFFFPDWKMGKEMFRYWVSMICQEGFPGGTSGKEFTCQYRRHGSKVQSLGEEDPLEESMATHSSILAWRIPWMEELGGLGSVVLCRVRRNWSNLLRCAKSCVGCFKYITSMHMSVKNFCEKLWKKATKVETVGCSLQCNLPG